MLVMGVRADRRDEGSLMIALAVVLVLTGLSLAVLARALGALAASGRNQDGAAALAVAQAGLSDAIYAISHQPTPALGAAPADFPAGSPQPFGDFGGSFQWAAHLRNGDPNTYIVHSKGAVHNSIKTVTETIFRWPFALLADKYLGITGPLPPGAIRTRSGDGGSAAIGSNGPIVLSGATGGDRQVYFAGFGGSCSGCAAPIGQPGEYKLPDPPSPPPLDNCPGRVVSVDELTPGIYNCTGANLTLRGGGSTLGTGQVVIYMTGDSPTLTLDGLSMSSGPLDDPTRLVIHMVGPGLIDAGNGFAFTGILDAPQSGLSVGDKCSISVLGALSVKTFNCVSDTSDPPFLSVTYDSRVASVRGDPWQVSGFSEIPTPATL